MHHSLELQGDSLAAAAEATDGPDIKFGEGARGPGTVRPLVRTKKG